MINTAFQSPQTIQVDLGDRLRQLRLNRNLDQAALASKAGISERTLRGLESGEGSSLITLIRVLKALDALASLDAIAPAPTVSPIAMLGRGRAPQRASKARGRKT